MKRRAKLLFTISLVVLDVSAIALAFYLAYRLRQWIKWPTPPLNIGPFSNYVGMMVVQIVAMLTVFFFYRLYHRPRALSSVDEFYSLFGAVSVGTIAAIALSSFMFKNSMLELDYSRGMILYAWLLTIVLAGIGRFAHGRVQQALQARGLGGARVLIVGTGEVGQMILQKILYLPGLGYEVMGFVDGGDPSTALRRSSGDVLSSPKGQGSGHRLGTVMGVPVLGRIGDLPSLIDKHSIDEVIIALPEASHEEILTIISLCERGKVSIKVYPDVFQIMAAQVSIGDLGGLPLLTVRDIALRGWRLTLKRAVDLIGSAIGLVMLSPLMLLVAVLVKLDSQGPVFYVQERMGLDARPFWMIKFRSMRADAEAETGPVWATEDDPRRTRLGAFIRRFSIDEWPQFINVLLGEMSLVGPRPERPVFVEQFRRSIPRYMDRHREKAGLTGWAQVNGLRGDTSIAERTKYDLWYIENWSLFLDFKIILKTIFNAFTSKNAY
jgi:exopolysaccharide biosynthesis polyprenyl glycosylphosphotransferase